MGTGAKHWIPFVIAAALAACANGVTTDDVQLNSEGPPSNDGQGSADASPSQDTGPAPVASDAAPSPTAAQDAGPVLADSGNPPVAHDASPPPAQDASPPPAQDASPPPPADSGSLCADPNTPAGCHACDGGSCQPNGCYNGYWCNTSTNRCHAPGSC